MSQYFCWKNSSIHFVIFILFKKIISLSKIEFRAIFFRIIFVLKIELKVDEQNQLYFNSKNCDDRKYVYPPNNIVKKRKHIVEFNVKKLNDFWGKNQDKRIKREFFERNFFLQQKR